MTLIKDRTTLYWSRFRFTALPLTNIFLIPRNTGLTVSLKLPATVVWVSCPRSVPSTILVAFAPFPMTI
jgi:hypothetical protein